MANAICTDCKQEMKPGNSCTHQRVMLKPGGNKQRQVFQRLPNTEQEICHDCNTPKGGIHHAGCDSETCPSCKGQMISCDCWQDAPILK